MHPNNAVKSIELSPEEANQTSRILDKVLDGSETVETLDLLTQAPLYAAKLPE